MNQRGVTLGLALAALALFYILLIPKPAVGERPPARPLSAEEGSSGYLGLWKWLTAENIAVVSLRDRFDTLPSEHSVHSTGNVLLTTLPHELPVRSSEALRLDDWIARGNTLVVAAALDDTPTWAIGDRSEFLNELTRLTRLRFEPISDDKPSPTAKLGEVLDSVAVGRTIAMQPRGTNPLLDRVHGLRVTSDFPALRWRAVSMDSSVVLQVAQLTGKPDASIWVKRQGNGQIIVIGVAGMFSNRHIGSVDNALLLSNIVAWKLGPGGRFIFDDVHQGAAKYYDAKAFFADARLHRTLGWLILLWFLFVLGIQRFAAPAGHWRPPDVTDFVATTGEFLASTLTPASAADRLLKNFWNAIRRRHGLLEDGSPLWDWLASQAGVLANEIAQLQQFRDRVVTQRRVDLTQLQNLLVKLQGKLV